MMDRVLSQFLNTTDLLVLDWQLACTSLPLLGSRDLHHAVSRLSAQRAPFPSTASLLKLGGWYSTVWVWFQGGLCVPWKHQEPKSWHLWLRGNGFCPSWVSGCSGREERGCQAWWITFCRCLPTHLGCLDTEAEMCVLSPLLITKCEELSLQRRNELLSKKVPWLHTEKNSASAGVGCVHTRVTLLPEQEHKWSSNHSTLWSPCSFQSHLIGLGQCVWVLEPTVTPGLVFTPNTV